MAFDYGKASSRNIGWVTAEQQLILRTERIATAGLDGVGCSHLVMLINVGCLKI